MYTCINLNKANLTLLRNLNKNRYCFNTLNEDFLEFYEGLNFIKKFFAAKEVKLLKRDDNEIGYIWSFKNEENAVNINSMYIKSDENEVEAYLYLLNTLKGRRYIYNCEKQGNNYEVLNAIGFKKQLGTYLMTMHFPEDMIFNLNTSTSFEVLKKGVHEELRCRIQNDVFKNDSRIPLTLEDMYYDELQSYYCEDGAVFVKDRDTYIGYGQVIIHDNIPTIVNIGILKEYRGRGYGKQLVLYLLNLLAKRGYKEAKLKVATDNCAALNLYKGLGFIVTGESSIFEYKK